MTDEQKRLLDIFRHCNHIRLADLVEMFGHIMGQHLYQKLTTTHDHDFITWICNLDYGNAEQVLDYLIKHSPRSIDEGQMFEDGGHYED